MTCDSPELITQNPNILLLKTNYNKIILIDKIWLLECQRIQDARIFRELFKLNENSPWGNFSMKKDDNGYITLFKDLDIDHKHWFNLQSFLKTGYTSFWHDTSKRDYYLEMASTVANKLGGFPSFDKFYENYMKNKDSGIGIHNFNNYNPLKPEKDYNDTFLWRIINPISGSWQDNEYIDSGWKITVLVSPSLINSNQYFAKKKKKRSKLNID